MKYVVLLLRVQYSAVHLEENETHASQLLYVVWAEPKPPNGHVFSRVSGIC